ncbi:MAG: DUF3500 domain-containing protein [Pirellulales bacterium]
MSFGMPYVFHDSRRLTAALAMIGIVSAAVATTRAAALRQPTAMSLSQAATAWLDTLDADQKARGLRPFGEATRTDWHFVPKAARKGVQLRDMTPAQEQAALTLLRSALSQTGYDKSLIIMSLEEILRRLEGDRAKNIRDPKRYFFTIFGTPADSGVWSLSIEGHHLSFNFSIRDGAVVDSTPQFIGANPAEVKTSYAALPEPGQRVLRDEEMLAFELVRSLTAAQRAEAVTAEAPKEIRAAGEPQPPLEPATGIRCGDLSAEQQAVLRRLVDAYCTWMPAEIAAERLRLIEGTPEGWNAVRFAWFGALEPGIGHAYRVTGPTFLIEFVNVQPDAEGNPANHIHCIWRDMTGDFDLPSGRVTP